MGFFCEDDEHLPREGTPEYTIWKHQQALFNKEELLRKAMLERNDLAVRLAKTELLLTQAIADRDAYRKALTVAQLEVLQ